MSFTSFLDGTRWSDIHTTAVCAFLAGTAMFTADFALLLRLQTAGHGGIAVASLIICATLPLVVLAPITGRLADRFDSRTLMVLSGVLQAGAIAAMAFTDDLFALLGLVVLNACGTALLQPTVGALTPLMATEADLPRAVAFVSSGNLLGMAAGPAAAGFIIGAHGVGAALAISAGCAALRALLCCDIRTRRGGTRRERVDRHRSPTAAWRLRDDRMLLTMVLGLSSVLAALCAVNVLSVFLVREVYDASESTFGLVRACWTVGMAGGAWIAAAVIARLKRDSQLAGMQMICLAGIGVVAFMQGIPLFTVFLLVPLNLFGGLFNAGENAALANAEARRVPEALRGQANAGVSAPLNAAQLIGFFLGGAMSTVLDVQLSFVLVGLISIAIAAACVPAIRRAARAEPRDGVPADAQPELAPVA
ncbi:MFS transporter [Glycomyces buryatensis]|uniref:MFS transporter n=1 Tax=Glycomyces buryatensis TaxID=2570927 RepID=A0A4S8QBL0_9ACTN|nr:MFS transporter [Glycomyces buryatensis]THV41887.1 MFS transporter [Glycomyces buryatensis]